MNAEGNSNEAEPTGEQTNDPVGSPRRRKRLEELMREEKIDFSEEAIARFSVLRMQIDTDY